MNQRKIKGTKHINVEGGDRMREENRIEKNDKTTRGNENEVKNPPPIFIPLLLLIIS